MKKQWKIALIAAPVLVAGSVFAFAAEGTEKEAASAESTSGVSHTIVDSQPLTEAELQEVASAAPAPVEEPAAVGNQPEGSVPQSVLDSANPFVVQQPIAPVPTAPASAQKNEFDLAQVKKFELKSNTTQGELKIEFSRDGDGLKLEGEIGGRKIEVKGAVAEQFLTKVLASLNLQQALTATLQGGQVSLDPTVLAALEEVKIELTDGRKIESKGNGNNPKAEGRHDNGKHKGWEKGKGHDKDDDDDDKKEKKEKDKEKDKDKKNDE